SWTSSRHMNDDRYWQIQELLRRTAGRLDLLRGNRGSGAKHPGSAVTGQQRVHGLDEVRWERLAKPLEADVRPVHRLRQDLSEQADQQQPEDEPGGGARHCA